VSKATKERAKKQSLARNRKVSITGSRKQTNPATAERRHGKADAVPLDAEPVARGAARGAGKKAHVQPATSKNGLKYEGNKNRRGAAVAAAAVAEVPMDRRANAERRCGEDRRKQSIPVPVERRKLERRAKVNRRRQIDPTTCERNYSAEEVEFMAALDAYKRSSGRMFPTCSEVLEVVRSLGYAKCEAEPAPPASTPSEPTTSVSNPALLATADIEPVPAMPVGA
jgi:hypothetical protein